MKYITEGIQLTITNMGWGCIMNWLEVHNSFVMVVLTFVYAFLTLLIVWEMRRSNKISKELERNRLRPVVVIYADLREYNLFLTMKNVGATTAYNIESDIPGMTKALWKAEAESPITSGVIPMLAPGQELSHRLTSIHPFNQKEWKQLQTLTFEGSVSYRDASGSTYRKERISIDLSCYIGIQKAEWLSPLITASSQGPYERALNDIAHNLQELHGVMKDIQSSLMRLR